MVTNILGTVYVIRENNELIESKQDGTHNAYNKVIEIRSIENMLEKEASDLAKKKRYDEVVRHEVIHAFFSESGLSEYWEDETLVDWMAVQFPKIAKVFKELECDGFD